MNHLRVVVDGEPSTDHRPRYSGRTKTGRPIMRSSTAYRSWKAKCKAAAKRARAEWEAEHGEVWQTEGLRFACNSIALLRADRKDADSCARAFRDAAEGILWRNDHQCRPVADDCWVSEDRDRPCLVVEVTPWDPKAGLMLARFEYQEG